MNFGFSEEQELLREQARRFLDEICPMDEVRRIMQTPEGYSPEQWKQIAELGWLGLTIPEQFGGAELGWEELILVLEECGRGLFPSPLISTTLAATAILDEGSDAQREQWLPRLADGSCIGTLALFDDPDHLAPAGIELRGTPAGDGFTLSGEKRSVPDAAQAGLLVVAFRTGDGERDLGLAVVDANSEGVSAENAPALDRTKRCGTLRLDGVKVGPDALLCTDSAWPAIERLVDRGALAVTAESIGGCEALLDQTVAYAKERIQFGSPIGRFQGVKHPLAELYVDIECMKSLLYYAAWSIHESPDEIAFSTAKAKALATEAFTNAGVTGIQLHGAIGYTDDCDIHLYLRRSKWARPMFGDETYHLDRVASMGGL